MSVITDIVCGRNGGTPFVPPLFLLELCAVVLRTLIQNAKFIRTAPEAHTEGEASWMESLVSRQL